MAEYVNLTPHDIKIHTPDGVHVVPRSGEVARLEEKTVPVGTLGITRRGAHGECAGCGEELDAEGNGCICAQLGIPWEIPIYQTFRGEIVGLPEPRPGVVYITSGMVAEAAARDDVLSPGKLVRDESGRPVGCEGLREWS